MFLSNNIQIQFVCSGLQTLKVNGLRLTDVKNMKWIQCGETFCVFLLNNQPDALITQILFCYKTLRVSGNLSAHHQEFSTVRSALLKFHAGFS